MINAIIYGDIGYACERIESLDALLPAHLDDYRSILREAAFLAARAHAAYRERGGTRQMILPDFLTGPMPWWKTWPCSPGTVAATDRRFQD